MSYRLFGVLLAVLIVAAIAAAPVVGADQGTKIRFGTLPVLQALPLYVAADKGLFSRAGVNVELIPFNTAADKDMALSTGSLDGCFADLVTPTVLRGNGKDIFIVATNYDTTHDRRMFGVLGKPEGKYATPLDLAGVPVAISSNSVIDYVTERLLKSAGVPPDKISMLEMKNIGLRFQMLMSGKVEAATLPEPLVSAAIAKGAGLLADDAGLAASQTVLVFSGKIIKEKPAAVKAFLKAVAEAAELVNTDPNSARPLMVQYARLPGPMQDNYPVPRFPKLHAPDKESLAGIVDWLVARKVIPKKLEYQEIVNDAMLR